MTSNSKIGAIAMMTALLGGTAGAFITRTASPSPAPAETAKLVPSVPTQNVAASADNPLQPQEAGYSDRAAYLTSNDKNYREGFSEGFRAAREESLSESQTPVAETQRASSRASYSPARTRYVTRNAPSYSSYRAPNRSFWSKHRDKLTVAMGAGGGAALGALVGGKKGAAIGALAGGAGSALYTYKIRKRNQRY